MAAQTRSNRFVLALEGLVLGVGALYFGQPVLMPLAVAVLLTFLLRPGAVSLERRGIPRPLAVGGVALAILVTAGSAGWMVTQQLHDLAGHLDEYRDHLHARIEWAHRQRIVAFDNVRDMFHDLAETGRAPVAPQESGDASSADDGVAAAPVPPTISTPAPDTGGEKNGVAQRDVQPAPVQIVPSAMSAVDVLRMIWNALSTPLALIAVTGVLVIFMLLEFEELRNRVLRLAGQNKLNVTTRTLDDVGRRISRYLLATVLVNGTFGLVVFLGLALIGVDYAVLWGVLAASLRFVPYVGPVVAASLAIGMAVLQFSDWTQPAMAAALFGIMELITYNVVEPLAYARSTGVSTTALLVAATFWAWVWGPMGLVLSVPLTVVLAVLGKNIPKLSFLGILLGDEPALAPHQTFYQRLLAGDVDEAAELLESQLQASSRVSVYDDLVVAALALADRDYARGELDEAELEFVCRNAHDLIEEHAPAPGEPGPRATRVVVCPMQDSADELASTMLQHLAAHCEIKPVGAALMASEKIAALGAANADVVVLSALHRSSASHVRYLCKRIRNELPSVRIVIGQWHYEGDRTRLAAALQARGADHIVTSLSGALDQLERIQPLPLSA